MTNSNRPDREQFEELLEREGKKAGSVDLQMMGISEIVYVKAVTSEEVKAFDADAFGNIPDGMQLFAVHTADGVPVALLDDRDTAFAAASQYEMRAVSVH